MGTAEGAMAPERVPAQPHRRGFLAPDPNEAPEAPPSSLAARCLGRSKGCGGAAWAGPGRTFHSPGGGGSLPQPQALRSGVRHRPGKPASAVLRSEHGPGVQEQRPRRRPRPFPRWLRPSTGWCVQGAGAERRSCRRFHPRPLPRGPRLAVRGQSMAWDVRRAGLTCREPGALPASSPVGLPGASEEGRGRQAFGSVPGPGADPQRPPCDHDAPVRGWGAGAGSAAHGRGPQGHGDPASLDPGDAARCSGRVAWS